MAGMTNYFGNLVLTNYLTAGTKYLALHSSDPGTGGTASTEYSGGGYARAQINWTAPSNRSTANSNSMQFLNLIAGTVSYLAIWDASSGGNCLYSVALTAPVTLITGQYITFPVSDIAVVLN